MSNGIPVPSPDKAREQFANWSSGSRGSFCREQKGLGRTDFRSSIVEMVHGVGCICPRGGLSSVLRL